MQQFARKNVCRLIGLQAQRADDQSDIAISAAANAHAQASRADDKADYAIALARHCVERLDVADR